MKKILTKGGFKATEQALRKYLSYGDFSHPFVVAGWTSSGKTALIQKVKKDFPNIVVKDFYCEQDKLPHRDLSETIQKIAQEYETSSDFPHVIAITSGLNIDPLRELLQHHVQLHILEIDINEWLEWARGMDEITGRHRVDESILGVIDGHCENLHSHFWIKQEIEQTMLDDIFTIENLWNNLNFDEVVELTNKVFKKMQMLYLTREDADAMNRKLLKALNNRLNFLEDKDKAGVVNLVLQMAEIHSKAFI